ncbi:hypothetical protein BN14_10873 [Rhizoctonia solani AG-1 IB]|uniref:Uncharacterized protein n=1 Tax=Thanatephorus cucumeris (strain AG1-IB / isolate 7/3/14) TaxID=1108050 RepID=M5CCA0_THACB|nr:hypothetical protein BN14_10873 [Rhizoctonia solani AG-1 IB]
MGLLLWAIVLALSLTIVPVVAPPITAGDIREQQETIAETIAEPADPALGIIQPASNLVVTIKPTPPSLYGPTALILEQMIIKGAAPTTDPVAAEDAASTPDEPAEAPIHLALPFSADPTTPNLPVPDTQTANSTRVTTASSAADFSLAITDDSSRLMDNHRPPTLLFVCELALLLEKITNSGEEPGVGTKDFLLQELELGMWDSLADMERWIRKRSGPPRAMEPNASQDTDTVIPSPRLIATPIPTFVMTSDPSISGTELGSPQPSSSDNTPIDWTFGPKVSTSHIEPMLYMLDEVASTEDPAEASPDADMEDNSEPEGDDMEGVMMSERNVSGSLKDFDVNVTTSAVQAELESQSEEIASSDDQIPAVVEDSPGMIIEELADKLLVTWISSMEDPAHEEAILDSVQAEVEQAEEVEEEVEEVEEVDHKDEEVTEVEGGEDQEIKGNHDEDTVEETLAALEELHFSAAAGDFMAGLQAELAVG